ncbi:uncharacterized protein BXZ73DRAFT_74556 [Epithele typhae]|uniref:uncharacterized protein n=1 Tax=Epithele typhae TaxID=378194 RepID=UPI0020088746|nr:uncharacterized protein BXZ73DRAFT_74556 [Epithele typhae]KAH9942271.1 hypothetical protein BXZ73DRAFT_74556 [Epithele typhae]
MDPAQQVDVRSFFPYTPNEVKHRKRTTRSQLKVLEDVYTYDTKPNASLRKSLAQELEMTPRGVQVWFQNRRAKTKQQLKKKEAQTAAAAKGASASTDTLPEQPVTAALDDCDDELKDEDAPSPALPATPLPPHAAEDSRGQDAAQAAHSDVPPVSSEEELIKPATDSRRGSIAPPLPPPTWAPSPSTSAPALPQPATTPSSLSSPSLPAHAHAPVHVRNPSAPPPPNAYSHSHIAPADVFHRRPSLPGTILAGTGHISGALQNRGFSPSARRGSSDMSRYSSHPYARHAVTASGHGGIPENEDACPPPQLTRRPSSYTGQGIRSGVHNLHHAHSFTFMSSQAQQPPTLPTQAQYDMSPIAMAVHHPHNYDLSVSRHSIDGSPRGLMQAHAHLGHLGPGPLDNGAGFNMSMGSVAPHEQHQPAYAISQRSIAPPPPGPLPSPNYSFGNPFAPPANSASTSSSNSASTTPPHGSSPPLLSLPRRHSEGGFSDADTEESSAGRCRGLGAWRAWVRAASTSGPFLEMFSDLDVNSRSTPAPPVGHESHHLQHASSSSSSSHLSPIPYPQHLAQGHSPDALGSQSPQMHSSPDADGGYPSPSSTISAGSGHSHQHTMMADHNSQQLQHGMGQSHMTHSRSSTSSELAYALQAAPEYPSATSANVKQESASHFRYPPYDPNPVPQTQGEMHNYYPVEQAHPEYMKQHVAHFPTVYEECVYPPPAEGHISGEGTDGMGGGYPTGAIELGHMCVPASEGVHFMGGYLQYAS